jgi:hypothetical protein
MNCARDLDGSRYFHSKPEIILSFIMFYVFPYSQSILEGGLRIQVSRIITPHECDGPYGQLKVDA